MKLFLLAFTFGDFLSVSGEVLMQIFALIFALFVALFIGAGVIGFSGQYLLSLLSKFLFFLFVKMRWKHMVLVFLADDSTRSHAFLDKVSHRDFMCEMLARVPLEIATQHLLIQTIYSKAKEGANPLIVKYYVEALMANARDINTSFPVERRKTYSEAVPDRNLWEPLKNRFASNYSFRGTIIDLMGSLNRYDVLYLILRDFPIRLSTSLTFGNWTVEDLRGFALLQAMQTGSYADDNN